MNSYIPENIRKFISDKAYKTDTTGISQSEVIIFGDMVLKTEIYTSDTDSTIQMIKWLQNRLPVPEIICHEVCEDKSYTLMSRVKGRMSCDVYHMEQAEETVALLAEGLKMLWSADISDCPRTLTFADDLKTARYHVENDMIDMQATDYNLLKENGFNDVSQLLPWLEKNVPENDMVLSHGDYCMPNVLIEDGKISGFIDLGECAVSDRWKDIAMCYISLKNNFSGYFGGKVYKDFNPNILFEKLGIEIDADKLKYYILLNELFKTK